MAKAKRQRNKIPGRPSIQYHCHWSYDVTEAELLDFFEQYVHQYNCSSLIRGENLSITLRILREDGLIQEYLFEMITDEWIDQANWAEEVDGVIPLEIDEDLIDAIRDGKEAEQVLSKEKCQSIFDTIKYGMYFSFLLIGGDVVDKETVQIDEQRNGDQLLFCITQTIPSFHWEFSEYQLNFLEEQPIDEMYEISGTEEFVSLAKILFDYRKITDALSTEETLPTFIEVCSKLGVIFDISPDNEYLLTGWCPIGDVESIRNQCRTAIEQMSKRFSEICVAHHSKMISLVQAVKEAEALSEECKKLKHELRASRSKIKELQKTAFEATLGLSAQNFYFDVLHGIKCEFGPLSFENGCLTVIVSVNNVELSEKTVWHQLAVGIEKRGIAVKAVKRTVKRWGGSSWLAFGGTNEEWNNIEHLYENKKYTVIQDSSVSWTEWKDREQKDLYN